MKYSSLEEWVKATARIGSFREVIMHAPSNQMRDWLPEDNKECIDLINHCFNVYNQTRQKRGDNAKPSL